MPTTRSGMRADGGDLRDRDARRVRGEDRVVGDVRLELREHLVLELELLGDGLDHEVRARRAPRRDRSRSGSSRRPRARRRAGRARRRELGAGLRALERLGADVVERRLDPGAREHGSHARGPSFRCRSPLHVSLCHLPSSFSSWMRRQTRSGVSGSSVIGTPASASALTIAAGTAASAPSPQPLAPYGPGPSSFSTITQVISPGRSSKLGTR